MAAINPEFLTEALPSELSLFDLKPTQTAVDNVYYHQIQPISQISDSSPIQFTIKGQNGMEFIDTRNSFMSIRAKIVHADGSPLLPTEYVGPVNLLAHALWDQVDVQIQGKYVTSATGHYPYKAMIQTLLHYQGNSSSALAPQMFYKDEAGYLDDDDIKTGKNSGVKKRASFFEESKSVHMIAPILSDLFQLERYILNNVTMDVKFYRSKPAFYLTTDSLQADYKIAIENMTLNICKVAINPTVIYAQSRALEHSNCKYPYRKAEVRMSAISQGQVNFNLDNVCQGLKPNRIVIGFVNGQSVAGSYNSSPWNFQGYDLSDICVYIDNIPVNGNAVRVNYDNTNGVDCTEPFHWLLKSSGKWLSKTDSLLNWEDISGGFALYAFDVEPPFLDRGLLPLVKQGVVRISANFSKPLPSPVTAIIYTESVGYFEIDNSRNVIIYQ